MDLKDLLEQVRLTLSDEFPESVWVRAEVASMQVRGTAARPGHCYMELCQSGPQGIEAKVRANVWQYSWIQISRLFRETTGEEIRPGIKVLVCARVNYSELYGLSLVIDDIDPAYTLGEAEARRRETIAKLEREGLMDLQKELALPAVPYSLAVISSPTAAGYGDFCRHLEQNEYGFRFRVDLFEALMQGESAPASIIDAIGRIEDICAESADDPSRAYDAVLILRGGGSVLDLACFDDCALCAAIARCPVPVFTAIGHERDTHVADMVACEAVKTPTALADLFISAFAEEDERICAFGTRLRLAFTSRLTAIENALERQRARILQSVAGKTVMQSAAIDRLEARIREADPRAVLKRGYTLTTDGSGVVRKSAAAFGAGDTIKVMFPDGTLNCTVNGKV